jgi:hypothetical protein
MSKKPIPFFSGRELLVSPEAFLAAHFSSCYSNRVIQQKNPASKKARGEL